MRNDDERRSRPTIGRCIWLGAVLSALILAGCGSGNADGDDGRDTGANPTDTGNGVDTGTTDGGGDGEGTGDAADTMQVEKFHPSCTRMAAPGATAEESTTSLERAFIGAESGDVICMAAGTYEVKRQLDITKSDIVIRGEGQSDTILDFSAQQEGANGILVQAEKNFGAVNFTIQNTASDALKTKRVDGVVMKNVTVTWEGEPKTSNGAYGLYPVESQNVLIEGCKVSKAADAGVYLGQSKNAILRNNEAFKNVIGLEVENTYDTDVYNNNAHGNTNGILVINLPGLEFQSTGARNRVYDNVVTGNNLGNFGKEGTAVEKMPAGSGILLVTANETEVFDNEIEDNVSVGIGVGNYSVFASNIEDTSYDPYPEGNWIHDNTFNNNGTDPKEGATIAEQPDGTAPQLFTMGTYDSSRDNSDGSLTNCAKGNQTSAGDAVEMKILEVTTDCPDNPMGVDATFCEVNSCTQDSLPEITLPDRVTGMLE